MSQCVECKTRMGYTETNVAREHKGLCVACHVKSLVKQKVSAANKPHSPTNVKSIDNLFAKFEDMLITSETSSNLRIRRRYGGCLRKEISGDRLPMQSDGEGAGDAGAGHQWRGDMTLNRLQSRWQTGNE